MIAGDRDMSGLLKAGVIGMGKMGILHTGILNSLQGVEVKALVDNQDAILNFIKGAIPAIETYKDYRDMLNKEELDLVYITTPTSLHTRPAIECVDRQIPFFVEKPLGVSTADCLNLVNAVKRNPVANMVGYSKRFVDTFSKAKEIIASKDLGNLIYFNSSMYVSQLFTKGKGWRYKKESSGGGVLNTLAAHLIDLLLWYFGDISLIEGNVKSFYSKDVEDFVHSYLLFEKGFSGYLDASWSVRNYRLPEIRIQVEGDRGMLTVTDDYLKVYIDKEGSWKTYYKQDLFNGVDFDLGGPEYTREDKHMIESIRAKRETGMDVFDGLKVQKIIEGIYVSASNKRAVDVVAL